MDTDHFSDWERRLFVVSPRTLSKADGQTESSEKTD